MKQVIISCDVPIRNHIWHRRKKDEGVEVKTPCCSKRIHNGTTKFELTKIIFSLRKNGGYISSSWGGRSVLVIRQASR